MDMNKLLHALGLGHVLEEPASVKGGLLHKMYHVVTSTGEYAVKVLNPEIMKRPDALSNTVNSEKIAKALEGLIPLVAALVIEGKQVQNLDGAYYLVFPWIDGASVFGGEITEKHCEKIGSILGKIHQRRLCLEGVTLEEDSFEMFDWERYLQRINGLDDSGKEWVIACRNAMEDIKAWNRKACAAGQYLSQTQVISHRDLDPKNVMWQEGMPYIIDWEAAGSINPFQELLEAVNNWADDGAEGLDKAKTDALMEGYCRYMPIGGVSWNAVCDGSCMGMLGWLEYNVKRALGIEAADKAEMALGERQVLDTIRALYSYQGKMKQFEEYAYDFVPWKSYGRAGGINAFFI